MNGWHRRARQGRAFCRSIRWQGPEDTIEHPGLPHAGGARLEFHPLWWLRDLVGQIAPRVFRVPRYGIRLLIVPYRMRMANCESITWGPVSLHRPRPWLRGPAMALHPELFDSRYS